jgi:FlaA1/EpsC-like NDP-sugar epimerase
MSKKWYPFKLPDFIRMKYFNRWAIFLADCTLSVCSTGIALLFVRIVLDASFSYTTLVNILLMSFVCSAFSILGFQIYKGVIRHSSFIEAGRICFASLLKVGLLFPIVYFLAGRLSPQWLFVEIIVDVFFTFFTLIVVRVALILVYNYLLNSVRSDYSKENILVLDTGVQSTSLFSSSLRNIEQTYRITGFLRFGKDEHLRMGGQNIYAVNSQEEFDKLVNRLYVKAVLFPHYASVKQEDERLIRYCEKKRIRMLVLPSIDEVKKGRINYRKLPEVRIEDLLDREEIKINMHEIANSLHDKVVLVTGAAGSIGSELCRQLCHFGVRELVLFDSAETPMHHIRLELEEKYPYLVLHPVMGDVRNRARVESTFLRFSPQVVFHAAAYKHVPLMEENPCEAVGTNVFGTMVVADIAVHHKAEKFIMISTDKAVNPTNVMGASKRLAEIYVQSLGIAIAGGCHKGSTRFITTRFGNVLGSNGSVIPRFREQLQNGGPLTVTHPDVIRYFMTIPEACRLVLEAAFMGEGNEIFIFDMGRPVKIDALARRMIELAGLVPGKDINIMYTGLRKGEKLYEELLAAKEHTIPTENEKIYRAKVREYNHIDVLPRLLALCEAAQNVEIMETVRQMKDLIPEFKSRQSEFERLDEISA